MNGNARHPPGESGPLESHAPNVIDVPVKGSDAVVTIDCSELPSDPQDFCELLSGEEAEPRYWIKLALEYRHISLLDQAIEILQKGLESHAIQRQAAQRFYFHSLLASLYLQRSRTAPTGVGSLENEQTKDFWQQKALQSLNDASRLSSNSSANTITKGVLSVMRADRDKSLDEASRHFESALKDNSNNLFAMLGRGRILYGRKKYKAALICYQKVLQTRPSLVPDPRIGIGLCFWQLDMKDDSFAAWTRAAQLDPSNVSATLLLGIYWLTRAFENVVDEVSFQQAYAKGIKFISASYKLKPSALAGIVLASYMFSSKKMDALHRTVEKVLAHADLSSLRADAFFWIARGQHAVGIHDKANSFYSLARQTESDMFIASMAIGQLQMTREDITDAKLTFESILEKHPKCIEALAILGSIYAQEALDPNFKGDKTTHRIKANACLDKAIHLTDEHGQRSHTDPSLHFTKAMLAEDDTAAHALRTLEQAADIQTDNGAQISPQILNNMAVIHHQEGSLDVAREVYQKALEECIKTSKADGGLEMDNLITTITYNLGRLEEQSGNADQAREIYDGLVGRYPDYMEPAARLAYMDCLTGNHEKAITTLQGLLDIDPSKIEIRALYGWLLGQQKRTKAVNFNDDPERKHFNHTLKHVDNYERYSLVALGNFYIRLGRETRPDSDVSKAERHKHYDMAIKFFERALHYDPKNAYAAQGLGIAFAEHKQYQKAIHIFGKVRETLRDESIFLNMGHCLCELHQYSRAIENYETALKIFHNGHDLNLYQCLGRAWLSRGREERSADFMREALRYTKLARSEAPENVAIAFNVAFVQFQFAEILRATPELSRTVVDLEEAAAGLEEAVKTFGALAEHKYPPYPKADLQQRAIMGRNTTTKQLERAIQQQKDYELKNSAKVAEAKAKREEERAKKEAALEDARRAEAAKQELLVEKRKEMQEDARKWAERKREEEEEREAKELEKANSKKEKKEKSRKFQPDQDSDDGLDDAEPGSSKSKPKTRKRRTLKRAKQAKNGSERDPEADDSDASAADETEPAKKTGKKRKLSRKHISAELVDSEDDLDPMPDEDMLGAPEIGAQAYSNESMTRDRERDEDSRAIMVAPESQPGAVPIESTNQPKTNGSTGQGDSILVDTPHASLRKDETPGIGVDGREV